jgi:glycosyltransferase involved in cell wall biosynthesis
VEEHELDAALSGADLAINLRFPSFGEASSSQLRIWAHGLPTIVTKTGWYADQSEDALIFVDPENMVAGLQGICNAFLDNHERFAGMGEVGRDILLQRHLPDVYASALLEVFTGLDRMKSHAAVNLLIRRSADKISSLCGEMSAGVYSGRVAKELHNAFSGSESGTAR